MRSREPEGRAGPPSGDLTPGHAWSWTLLRPQWSMLGRQSTGRRITSVVFFLLGLGIFVGIYLSSVWFLDLCHQVEVVGPLLVRRLLDIVLLVLLSVLLLSNVVTALSIFFLAQDLEILVTAPIPPRSFFGARFLQTLLHSSWMVAAFGLPVLFAFATVAGTPATYFYIVFVLPAFLIFPAAAGVSITLLLGSLMPASRVRNIVVALFFIAFITLYVTLRLMEPEKMLNPDGFASMVNLLVSLSSPSGGYLPSYWTTAVLASTFQGAHPSASWPLMLAALWCGAGASFALTSFLFRRLHGYAYAHGMEGRGVAHLSRLWARIKGAPPPIDGPFRTPGRRAPRGDWMRRLVSIIPAGPYREMVLKDIKLLLRDASQWSQLVLLLALVFVYLYNFRHFKSIGDAGLVGPLALFLVGMGLSAFVTAAVSVRFAFPLMSLEGRLIWLLYSAPIPHRQLLYAKLMSTLPPLLIVAELMSVISSLMLGVSLSLVLLGAVVSGMVAVSVGAIAVGMGAMLPDYRAESAAKVATSFGSLVCMIVVILVALVLVGLAIYPAYLIFADLPLGPGRLLTSVAGLIVVTGLAVYLPLRLGVRALTRYEP